MEKIDYALVVFFIFIVLIALYFRYYYQPGIDLHVSFGTSNLQNLFPLRQVDLPIIINNTGSSNVDEIGFEVLVKNSENLTYNSSTNYRITVPAGKEAIIYFNFTPTEPGNYSVMAIADPAKFYNIVDRSNAQATKYVYVNAPQPAEAYSPITGRNLTYLTEINMSQQGSLVALYLNMNYSLPIFDYTDINLPYTFFSSLITMISPYIRQINVAYANYTNGSSIYSVWIRGYLNPDLVKIALNGTNASVSTYEANGTNVTVAELAKNVSLCSWYSDGWIKSVAYKGPSSCIGLIGANNSNYMPITTESSKFEDFDLANSTLLASYDSYYFPTASFSAEKIFEYGNEFVAPSINENIGDNKCYGIISSVNNQSYCSTYLFQTYGKIMPVGLVRTSEYLPPYNLSVFALTNESLVLEAVPLNVNLLKLLNFSGKSVAFESGFASKCSIAGFGCANVTFASGSITFRLGNEKLYPVKINNVLCSEDGTGMPTKIDSLVNSGSNTLLTAKCYSMNQIISGLPFNLNLKIILNYTSNNVTALSKGNATVNFFS
ncbi:MAG: hypothetical protein ACP5RF_01010 [Candidatus Micrarchaeia archaeon]